MKFQFLLGSFVTLSLIVTPLEAKMTNSNESEPPIPHFSVDHMDPSINPSEDFYHYASGNWIKNNPVPSDRSRWTSFDELRKRNVYLIHDILDEATADTTAPAKSPRYQVGNLMRSAMDTEKLEALKLKPIAQDIEKINAVKSADELIPLISELQTSGFGNTFSAHVGADEKESDIYAFYLRQGGLSLPDRDYYLEERYQQKREAYLNHLQKMFMFLGEDKAQAQQSARTVLSLETDLAKVARPKVELRDPLSNYNKISFSDLQKEYPNIPWQAYFAAKHIQAPSYVIMGQPKFFAALNTLIHQRPLSDWQTYLRWRVLHAASSFLNQEVENETFDFYGRELSGVPEQEPRWKRAADVIDDALGEALGKLYVEKYFPADAKARMDELVLNLHDVFQDHLKSLTWMTDETKEKALRKFDRFVHMIGHPDKFRDYSSIEIRPDDYLGNIRRATEFEIKRDLNRIGQKVDKTEWGMTPPTVNAYFEPSANQIVFPAGILQPPFFDPNVDDAVNYGAIGVVIGHEMTHGFDDQGRHYDENGNLVEWWGEADAKEFELRTHRIVDQYNHFEVLPGIFVNGQLTLGENIADLGGVSIAYDALQRALEKDPSKRRLIDGLTPEQRFFISYAQTWRINIRDEAQKARIMTDVHSPGKFRAIGPLRNFEPFYQSFGIKQGSPMWLAPELRAQIW